MNEIYRVLRRGGVLFMTVPSMSLLRKLKARLGKHPQYIESEEMVKRFYQFVLDPKKVIRNFSDKGFELLAAKKIDGFYGISNEIDALKKVFHYLHSDKNSSKGIFIRLFEFLSKSFTNHLVYIMKKA
jgi:hypothetical protein